MLLIRIWDRFDPSGIVFNKAEKNEVNRMLSLLGYEEH
jgi:hypothetical protein